jgi:hypothetical protein
LERPAAGAVFLQRGKILECGRIVGDTVEILGELLKRGIGSSF